MDETIYVILKLLFDFALDVVQYRYITAITVESKVKVNNTVRFPVLRQK